MIRFRYPILMLAGLWVMLYRDHLGLVRISLLCSLLHESGHLLVWWKMTHKLPELILSPRGIGLAIWDTPLSLRQESWLAAAGPAMNFLLAAASWAVLNQKASYWGYYFMGTNLLVGLFNLLPFGDLDGKRLWKNLLGR